MKKLTYCITCFLSVGILFFVTSCQENISGNEQEISESLELIEEVKLLSGGESTTIVVNRNGQQQAYFDINFIGIEENDIITNGKRDGWCIDVRAPLDLNNGTYEDLKLYSTYLVKGWRKVNYLFNIRENLKESDPDLTWREFQIAIWALRANPQFNLDEIKVEELPEDFRENGEINFNLEKVKAILESVEEGYQEFDYGPDTKYAVIAATPPEIQTVITFVES